MDPAETPRPTLVAITRKVWEPKTSDKPTTWRWGSCKTIIFNMDLNHNIIIPNYIHVYIYIYVCVIITYVYIYNYIYRCRGEAWGFPEHGGTLNLSLSLIDISIQKGWGGGDVNVPWILRHQKMLLCWSSLWHTEGGWGDGAMLTFMALRNQKMLLRWRCCYVEDVEHVVLLKTLLRWKCWKCFQTALWMWRVKSLMCMLPMVIWWIMTFLCYSKKQKIQINTQIHRFLRR